MKAPESSPRQGLAYPVAYAAATVMFCLSSYSEAAEWTVIPRLTLRETYTDNVRLGTGGGDFVTQINPGILLTGTARRFRLDANYLMNNLIYADHSNLTRMRHQLNANATAELVEDFFFVDGRAAIAQQNMSLAGPQAIDNVNVTGNRADVRTFSVSPYIRHRFKDFASAEVRYVRNTVTTSANSLRNSQGDSFLVGVNSGAAFSKLQWGANYSNQMIHFDRSGRTIELERSIANLRYMVTRQFALTATGGYERNSFISIRGDPSSPTWTAGFAWAPSQRTNIVANAGQRFFGDTYFVQANHRTRLTIWDIGYDENITTFNQQAMAGMGMGGLGFGAGGFGAAGSLGQLLAAQNPSLSPVLIQQNSDALLGGGVFGSFFDPTNFLTNRLFLQKRLQASVALNGSRNTVLLRGFNMTRQAYSPDDADAELVGASNAVLFANIRQTGGNALWSYRVSPLTSANLTFGYTRFTFLTTDRVDDLRLFRASLSRQLPQILPNLIGMLEYRHNNRASNQTGGDYRENAVSASLNMSF